MKRLLTIFLTLCMVLSISGISAWADGETGWQEEASMPTGKRTFVVAVVNDNIYAIGGYNTNTVEIYDTKTNTWDIGAPIPVKTSRSAG
ncbi:kelch repeat-containing protein, partial [Anaerovorax odorimutans]|uniref:kelch repeat-containing protein n=1 Tax=Anaerovorax odorimutans TaxID=109327 RepID=UPI000482AC8D